MAVKPNENQVKRSSRKSLCSNVSKCSSKIYFTSKDNIANEITLQESKHELLISPYIDKNRIEESLTSNVCKKTKNFISSFPLAISIYKANSGEFKNNKRQRTHKKSVLTLPNKPAPLPQTCTVSDMNESDYAKDHISCRKKLKTKNLKQLKNKRKLTCKDVDMEFYDEFRSSQHTKNADSGSIFCNKNVIGDGKKINRKSLHESNLKDVWSMIRNINKFQFKSSPSMSEDSGISIIKNNNAVRNHNFYNNSSFVETKQTEEFAFFSCYDIENSCSRDSLDRITVIDKLNNLHEVFEKNKCITSQTPINRGKNKTNNHRRIMQNANSPRKRNRGMLMNREKNYLRKGFQENSGDPAEKPHNKCKYEDVKDWIEKITCQNRNLESCQEPHSILSTNDTVLPNSNISSKLQSVTFNTGNIKLQESMENELASKETYQEINGITKVILNKPERTLNKYKSEVQSVKTRMMVSKCFANPKLTEAVIKRRLANIKFPLVILGKDELSSSFTLLDYETTQFTGLDEHIWPFMVNWSNGLEVLEKDSTRLSIDIALMPFVSHDSFHMINKEQKRLFNENIRINSEHKEVEPKFIKRRKGSMFKLLQGKYSISAPKSSKTFCKDTSTNTPTNLLDSKTKLTGKPAVNKLPRIKYSWARAKRASDFIENIIKKIKCGVYYNYEQKDFYKYNTYYTTEKYSQTENTLKRNDDISSPQLSLEIKQECISSIPGFEETLSNLKIEAFNRSEITVKHCVTNMTIKFDIATPSETKRILQLKKLVLFKPLLMESETKLYKCEKTILNTVLPAELCSILPYIMRRINEFSNNLKTHKVNEKTEHLAIRTHDVVQNLIIPCKTSLNKIEGTFAIKSIPLTPNKNIKQIILTSRTVKYKTDIFPYLNLNKILCCHPFNGVELLNFDAGDHLKPNFTVPDVRKLTCMSVQLYSLQNKQIIPAYKRFNLMGLIEMLLCKNYKLGIRYYLATTNYKTSITIEVTNEIRFENMKLINLNGANKEKQLLEGNNTIRSKFPNKFRKGSFIIKTKIKPNRTLNFSIQRRQQIRHRSKCKSMSNISESQSDFPLVKITSLNKFFQVLGPAKCLSNVLDKESERIILSCLAVMKTWITYITPTQALLVLFFATKKVTTNLVRYRLLILQGIAVNRITKISELDMEIEVIENERFHKISQFSGVNCLSEPLVNQDNLLEELIWIAKTTASDYQKPFEECSERHIRSLLQKRKKLNPSYLRVMARYIGLGLLKITK